MTDDAQMRPIGELSLPGPDDPVAWKYVKPGTPVHGADGHKLGVVEEMQGSDQEDIFHGISVRPDGGGDVIVIGADAVVWMSPSKVEVTTERR